MTDEQKPDSSDEPKTPLSECCAAPIKQGFAGNEFDYCSACKAWLG